MDFWLITAVGKTTFFSLLLDLIQPSSGHIKSNNILVNESEEWKPFTSSFIDESFLIGYLTAEEYFYFIGELRNQNKADVDKLLAQFEDFFHDEILGKKSKKKNKKDPKVKTYIVEKGDTLYSLSRKFNVSVDSLKEYNGLESNTISIGQELYIHLINN